MRIMAVSDLHGFLPKLDIGDADRVLIAGDVCPASDHSSAFQRRWLETRFHQWVSLLGVPVYLAMGNHDFIADFKAPNNLRYSTEEVVDDVLLFSWVPMFFDWAWMAEEDEIARRLESVLGDDPPPVWVCHGPPRGVCDEVRGEHKGSWALAEAALRHQPRLIVCGHLHEGTPEGMLGDTRVINASLLNDRYRRHRDPIVIDLPD